MQFSKKTISRLRTSTVVAVAGCAMATAAFSAGASSIALASKAGVSAMDTHGAHVGNATSSGNLVDNGGKVLATSNTYALYWGPSTAWASDVQTGIASFFSGLNGSSFLNTGAQYMRGAAISSAFQGTKTDSSAPASKVQPSTLGTEIQKVYGTNLDTNGIYFVFTSNFPAHSNFCAWHSYATVGGKQISVAYMPNTTGVAGCDPGNLYGVSGSQGLRSLVNVTSHEYMEAITDAIPASGSYGWIDSAGSEIGDKCAWTFGSAVTLSNGSVWQLQKEWSNAVNGCVQTS